jgi:Putative bacterial sensory transduction regulator
MRVDSLEIEGFLKKLEWTYRVVGEGTILTGIRCAVPFYYYIIPIQIRIGGNWVYVRALLQQDVSARRKLTVLRLVSRWNERCYRTKFLLVNECVVIQSEVAIVQCHFGTFCEALEAVCRYSTLAGPEIAVLATDPMVGDLFEELATSRDARLANGMADGSDNGELVLDFDISVNTLPD